MYVRIGLIAPAFGAIVLSASLVTAQTPPGGAGGGQGRGGQNQEPPKNLQVLPKDWTRQQVGALMNTWTQALGVRCEYCHIDEGRGGRQDFAADEKAPKATARVMVKMANDINTKLKSELTNASGVQVQCVTCHRGVSIPRQLAEILTKTTADKGAAAAMDEYRDLRKRYYGASAYDFSENGLLGFAQRQAQASPDDAIKWAQLNLEFNPKSARSYVLIANVLNGKGDKDGAIKSVEKALEIDPENNQAKQMLQRLKGGA